MDLSNLKCWNKLDSHKISNVRTLGCVRVLKGDHSHSTVVLVAPVAVQEFCHPPTDIFSAPQLIIKIIKMRVKRVEKFEVFRKIVSKEPRDQRFTIDFVWLVHVSLIFFRQEHPLAPFAPGESAPPRNISSHSSQSGIPKHPRRPCSRGGRWPSGG